MDIVLFLRVIYFLKKCLLVLLVVHLFSRVWGLCCLVSLCVCPCVSVFILILFLDACTRLYKPLCWSVRRLVRRSVGWSVGPSIPYCKNEPNWRDKTIRAMETISNDMASAVCCVYSIVTAPAQQHATKPSVYTALLDVHPSFSSSLRRSYQPDDKTQAARLRKPL